jgi:hypothetical protein
MEERERLNKDIFSKLQFHSLKPLSDPLKAKMESLFVIQDISQFGQKC